MHVQCKEETKVTIIITMHVDCREMPMVYLNIL